MKAFKFIGYIVFKAKPSTQPLSAHTSDNILGPVPVIIFPPFFNATNMDLVLWLQRGPALEITCPYWPCEPAQVVTWIQLQSRGAISSARRLPAPSEGSLLYLCSHSSPMKHSGLVGKAVQDIEP